MEYKEKYCDFCKKPMKDCWCVVYTVETCKVCGLSSLDCRCHEMMEIDKQIMARLLLLEQNMEEIKTAVNKLLTFFGGPNAKI